jgi:hypothetical protein
MSTIDELRARVEALESEAKTLREELTLRTRIATLEAEVARLRDARPVIVPMPYPVPSVVPYQPYPWIITTPVPSAPLYPSTTCAKSTLDGSVFSVVHTMHNGQS